MCSGCGNLTAAIQSHGSTLAKASGTDSTGGFWSIDLMICVYSANAPVHQSNTVHALNIFLFPSHPGAHASISVST